MVKWFVMYSSMLCFIAIDKAEWANFLVGISILNELMDIEEELKK